MVSQMANATPSPAGVKIKRASALSFKLNQTDTQTLIQSCLIEAHRGDVLKSGPSIVVNMGVDQHSLRPLNDHGHNLSHLVVDISHLSSVLQPMIIP